MTEPQQITRQSFDLLTLFSLCVAVYGLAQFFYSNNFSTDPNYVLLAVSALLALYPHKVFSLVLFAAVSLGQYLAAAPLTSNHMMLAFILWLYVIVAWIFCAASEKTLQVDPEKFYRLFAPPGRLLLLTMYFFGVFHKINSAFLDSHVSCASMVIDSLIFVPEHTQYPDFIYHLAAYGTLAGESLIAVLLVFPRTRYFGVVAGILFHMLISFSAYRFYVPFTMVSICMHMLFLDSGTLQRLENGFFRKLLDLRSSLPGRILLAVPLCLFFLTLRALFDYHDLVPVLRVWGGMAFVIAALVIVYDYPGKTLAATSGPNYFFSRAWPLTIFAALFFISCFSPYIGFKTGQTINMFSNLQTEEGKSNHYIIRHPWYLFDYQNDLVRILETDDPSLKALQNKDLAVAGYYFDSLMLQNPHAHVKFTRHGETREINGLDEAQIKELQKTAWLRKFVVFNTISTQEPRPCMDAWDEHRKSAE